MRGLIDEAAAEAAREDLDLRLAEALATLLAAERARDTAREAQAVAEAARQRAETQQQSALEAQEAAEANDWETTVAKLRAAATMLDEDISAQAHAATDPFLARSEAALADGRAGPGQIAAEHLQTGTVPPEALTGDAAVGAYLERHGAYLD